MRETLKRVLGRGVLFTGWKNALVCALLFAVGYVTNDIYLLLNHGPAAMILRTPLDDALPVVPVFIIPYVSLDLFVYGTLLVFLLLRTRIFQSAGVAMMTAWIVSYLFYFFLQTEVIRPALAGTEVFTGMIRQVYAGDNPFNDFPSLHTSVSAILALHWFKLDRRAGWAAAIWTALIVASTVLIKQHYLADLFAGLALAFGASWLAGKAMAHWPEKDFSSR